MRGATELMQDRLIAEYISIHAPHAGCDITILIIIVWLFYFNPRTPCWVRHLTCITDNLGQNFNPRTPYGVRRPASCLWRSLFCISIHAPHTGCDPTLSRAFRSIQHFNPRTPYGVRLHAFSGFRGVFLFQSTHPIRGATARTSRYRLRIQISIHAPHTGCDPAFARGQQRQSHFNPRTPYGVRPCLPSPRSRRLNISIHAPHTGCDPHNAKSRQSV